MGKFDGIVAGAFLGLVAHVMAPAALISLPAGATHVLTASCQWQARPWARFAGVYGPRPTPETERRRWACLQARGLRSPPSASVSTLLARFPSRAELAALAAKEPPYSETALPALPYSTVVREDD